MATAEGVYPKVGGDPPYASELNVFARAGRYIGIGSTATLNSGTAFQDTGSIVIGAGSLSNPCFLMIDTISLTTNIEMRTTISGISANANFAQGDAAGGVAFGNSINAILGSPFPGRALQTKPYGYTNVLSSYFTLTTLNNLDTDDVVVIKFEGKTNTNGGGAVCYGIQAFGDL